MKKILSLSLVFVFIFMLSACTQPNDDDNNDDTSAVPVLSGISSVVTKTAGDEFDPLAGVTATDEEDGDITSDIELTGEDCLALVDGVLTTGGLECTLTYTVEDSDGETAMKVSTVTVQKAAAETGENMVVNGDFAADQLDVWQKGEFEGGAATFSIDEEMLKVEITAVSWGSASPRLHQAGMTYETGKTYEVSFDAKADDARTIASQVGVLVSAAPWFINYDTQHLFDLTTEMQTFSYEFTVTEADTTDGVVTFEMGTFDGDPDGGIATTIYYDNISVLEVEAGEEPVINGATSATLDNPSGFDILAGVAAVDPQDGILTDDITTVVTGPNDETTFDETVAGLWTIDYSVTDSDANTTTVTRELTLIVAEEPEWAAFGTGYTFTENTDSVTLTYDGVPASLYDSNFQYQNMEFNGMAEELIFTFTGVDTHEYLFKVEGGGQAVEQRVTADGTEQTVTLDLSALTAEQRSGLNLIIVFVMTAAATGSVEVSFDAPVPLLETYPNQDFTDTDITGWVTEGTVTVAHDADGYLVASVSALGANPWDALIGFGGQTVMPGYTYTVEYTLKTAYAAGRDVTFFVENTDAGFAKYFETTDTLTDEFQTFTFTFVPDAINDDTKVGIFLGNTTNPLTGDVIIDSIVITKEEVVNPEWAAYGDGYTFTENTDSVTLTYDGVPAGLYDSNFQYQNMMFDGANDQLVFTFTGVDTHEYLFKVEGGGQFVEQRVTADGTEQTVTLDLSALTVEQRSGLNKIVVFVMTAAATGSVEVSFEASATPVWAAYGAGYTLTENTDSVTLTYDVPATGSVYDANFQYQNMMFDGANDQLVFTFTGVDTHEYLFKVEGGTATPVEQSIVADGTEQTVTLDLSALTVEQRSGLNLIIVFGLTPGASGSVEVSFDASVASS